MRAACRRLQWVKICASRMLSCGTLSSELCERRGVNQAQAHQGRSPLSIIRDASARLFILRENAVSTTTVRIEWKATCPKPLRARPGGINMQYHGGSLLRTIYCMQSSIRMSAIAALFCALALVSVASTSAACPPGKCGWFDFDVLSARAAEQAHPVRRRLRACQHAGAVPPTHQPTPLSFHHHTWCTRSQGHPVHDECWHLFPHASNHRMPEGARRQPSLRPGGVVAPPHAMRGTNWLGLQPAPTHSERPIPPPFRSSHLDAHAFRF